MPAYLRRSEKGMTLIELITAIVLLTIVFGAITGYLLHATRIFTITTKTSELQSQLRIVLSAIKEELITASKVELLDTPPALTTSYDVLLYADSPSSLCAETMNGIRHYVKDVTDISFTFARSSSSEYMLEIKLQGKTDDKTHTEVAFSDEIYIENLEKLAKPIDGTGTQYIYLTKAAPVS